MIKSSRMLSSFKAFSLAILLLFFMWQLLSSSFGGDIIPSPLPTLRLFVSALYDPIFLNHIKESLKRLLLATLLASLISYPLGLMLGLCKRADAIGAPLLYLTYPLPKIVLLPVFFLLLGLGDLSRISLIALTGGYQIVMIVRAAARGLNPVYAENLSFMGASFLTKLIHVYIAGTLQSFLTALKVASGTMVAVLFLAESFATDSGLGFLIMDAWGIGDTAQMFCAILGISLIGAMFYSAIYLLERTLCPWSLHTQRKKRENPAAPVNG